MSPTGFLLDPHGFFAGRYNISRCQPGMILQQPTKNNKLDVFLKISDKVNKVAKSTSFFLSCFFSHCPWLF